MKTSIKTALLIASIVLSGFFTTTGTNHSIEHETAPATAEVIVHEGVMVPHYTLPVVEITADRKSGSQTRAIVINGEIMPLVELEEVVIMPAPAACGC